MISEFYCKIDKISEMIAVIILKVYQNCITVEYCVPTDAGRMVNCVDPESDLLQLQ